MCIHGVMRPMWSAPNCSKVSLGTKICVFLVRCTERSYLCTKSVINCLWILSMGVFQMHNAKKVCFFSVACQTHIPLHQKCDPDMSLDTYYGGV